MINENKFFDINKLPIDGYLIFPLSMSRLATVQSAEKCYEALEFFEKKITKISLDVIFLYTNGLYFNNNEPALEVRKRTTDQMLSHKNAIMNLILKKNLIRFRDLLEGGNSKKSFPPFQDEETLLWRDVKNVR